MRTSATTAERAIEGDPEAIRALWETNRRWLAAIVLAHKPRAAELDDLLQEVAVRIVRKLSEVRDPATVRPWMRAIAINVARTAGRRQSTSRRLLPRIDADPRAVHDAGADERPATAATDEARAVMAAAERLHPDYREPLLLRCVRGMSYRQISDLLGLPVTTIETRLARARRMVREELDAARPGAATPANPGGHAS